MHVGGTAGSTGAITSDYLNHSATPSAPGSNPYLVYSDGNGTLKNLPVSTNSTYVLHGDGSWSAGGNGNVTSCSGTANYIPIYTSSTGICISQIYDNGTNIGIGYGGSLPGLPQKLSVNGNLRLNSYSNGVFLGTDKFLSTNSTGANVYLGVSAGPTSASTGTGTICIGPGAGYSLSNSENHNILLGNEAGKQLSGSGSDAEGNICLGYDAGYSLTTGRVNVCIGTEAGNGSFSTHSGNVIIGVLSGNVGAGDNNVLIGNDAELTSGTFDNSCAIGFNAVVEASNSIAIGANSRCTSADCISLGDCSTSNVRTLMGFTTLPTIGSPTSDGFRLYVNAITGSDAGYFAGFVFENGAYVSSDANLKSNILPLSDTFTSDVLSQLLPKSYNFDVAGNPSLNLPEGNQYGLIAQDVETILPGLVREVTAPPTTDSLGNIVIPQKTFKALKYTGLIPFLVQSLKSQQNIIDSLVIKDSTNTARIDHIEQLINNCCSDSPGKRLRNSIDVEIGSENTIILNQNDPNPFAEQTRITYTVPPEVHEAKIIFFDNTGHVMQTVKINERGPGLINVYGEKLSSGIYSYSLIADDKIIDTKKMVCNK